MKRIGLHMSKNRMKKANIFKIGDLVELIEDTYFYKKGMRAIVLNNSSEGNTKKMEIRYEGEKYIGGDVDIVLKSMFKVIKQYKKECEFTKQDYELINASRDITGIYNYSDEYYYNNFIL